MDAISDAQARDDWSRTMDRVCDDRAPILITRENARSVVLMSLEEYQALQETTFLLRRPRNARRLLESIAEMEDGGGTDRELEIATIHDE